MKKNLLFIPLLLFVSFLVQSQEKPITKEINPVEINTLLNKKGKSMLSAAKNNSYEEFRLNFADLEIYMNYLEKLGMPREQLEEDLERTDKMLEFPIRKVFVDLVAHIDSMPKQSKINLYYSWSFQFEDGMPRIEPISYLFELGSKGVVVDKLETNNLSSLLIKKKAITLLFNSSEIESLKAAYSKNNKNSELVLDKWKSDQKK